MTVQTSYSQDLDVKFPGRYTVSGRGLRSAVCSDADGIPFGRVVVYSDTTGTTVCKPYSNRATIALDGPLVTSNVLSGNLVVGGTTTAYTETYASSSNATLDALAAEIQAISGILTAVRSGNSIVITSDPGVSVYVSSGAVTLGAGQAAVTLTNTCTLPVAGVAVHSEKEPESDGTTYYNELETVPVLVDGDVDIVTDDALDVTDTIYFRFYEQSAADEKAGMIGASDGLGADTSPSTSLVLSGAKPLDSVAAAGLARIAFKLP